MKIYVLVCEKGAAALPLCLLVMSAQKTRKNPPTPPLQNTPNSHFIPCTVHPSLVSSGPVHTLTITLPLTLKPNLPSTLTFPTLRDFLGELELHFARFSLSLSLSLSLSQEMTSISGCKHACLMFFFFFFFPSCSLYHSANPAAPWEHPSVWLGSSDPPGYLHLLFSESMWDSGGVYLE